MSRGTPAAPRQCRRQTATLGTWRRWTSTCGRAAAPAAAQRRPQTLGSAAAAAPGCRTSPLREERKLVSILFVDLVGFTASADRADPEDVREALQLDALFVSGFALFQSDTAAAATAAMTRFRGSWLGVDVASPGLAGRARADGFGFAASRPSTVLFATAAEAKVLAGAEAEEAARLLSSEVTVACVKLGAEGAVAAAGGTRERRRVDAAPRRGAFGAGDAFAGALLVALPRGAPLGEALEQACAAGARAPAAASL